MIASGSAVFTNPGDYGACIADAKIDLVLTQPGEFKARLTWLKLDHLHVYRCREDVPRIAFISLSPTRTYVSFPLTTSSFAWNGVELQPEHIVLYSSGEPGHQWTKRATHWAFVSYPALQFTDHCRTLADLNVAELSAGQIFRLSTDSAARLRRLHSKACNLVEAKPEAFAHHEAAHAVEQEFLHLLVNCLARGSTLGVRAMSERHTKIMTRFEEMILHRRGVKPPNISQFCATVGVSERGLRSWCIKSLGLSPNQYIRLRRLNLVRADLLRVGSATVTVTQVALRYHFSELGRFAAAYRTLFGEDPSVTLTKARKLAGIA